VSNLEQTRAAQEVFICETCFKDRNSSIVWAWKSKEVKTEIPDPIVVKGHALFQSQSCNSCHGEGGIGTAAAVALTGVGVKYSESHLEALLHAPNSKMTGGGMQPVVLKPQDLEALSTYLRQLH